MQRPVIIFDFDGTVALGDGPLLAYARAVAEQATLDDGFVEAVASALGAPESGVVDGYDLVRREALVRGADDDDLAAAYATSREHLGGPAAPVLAPEGLAEFLRSVDAERILVTNAPLTRLDAALAAMGLDGLFDRIVSDAAKPLGLERLLDELGDGTPVLSIGDVWRNDLAPAHARGHATALVGGYADRDATPTFHAVTLEELLPRLAEWAASVRIS